MQDGGGRGQLMERSSFTVTAYTKIRLDRGDHATHLLQKVHRGVLHLKRKSSPRWSWKTSRTRTAARSCAIRSMPSRRPRYNHQTGIAMIAGLSGPILTGTFWKNEG